MSISRGTVWSPSPGVALLRLAAGDLLGWAAGPVTQAPLREALRAARGRDPLEVATDPEAATPAQGLVALAALDLAAQRERVPAALLLGARIGGRVPVTPPPSPLPAGAAVLSADPASQRAALLDPATLLLLVDPVTAGGLAGLRRIVAAAEALAVEIALIPAAHSAAVAAAIHLQAALPWLGRRALYTTSTWQPDAGEVGCGWRPHGARAPDGAEAPAAEPPA